MHIKTPRKKGDGGIGRSGWLAGTVGSLLFISIGLELLAHRVFGQIDMDTLVWSLYLGFWAYVLGSIGFLILLGRWFVDWRRVRASRTAMNQLSFTESKHRRFEEPELEGPSQILEQGIMTEGEEAIWLRSKGRSQSSRERHAESDGALRSASHEMERASS